MKTKRTAVIDIESNNFTENLVDYSSFPYKFGKDAKLWCVVIRDLDTGEDWYAELDDITEEWLEKTLKPFYYIIAHNGIKFDFPQLLLFKVLNYKIGYLDEPDLLFGREVKFLDSLILSRLSNPDRPGHSLKYWGNKVGEFKDDYRQQCIDAGYISAKDPKGAEFREYNPLMLPYCRQDCKTNAEAFKMIVKEFSGHNWGDSLKMEQKLADLAFRREHLGFAFDKDLAIKCLDELNDKLQELSDTVLPLIPPKPLNQGEEKFWTPPKKPTKKNGELSSHMINFLSRVNAKCKDDGYIVEGKFYPIDNSSPLKTSIPAEMKDLDHIKMHLISLGWEPIEWSERDMTKDSKKKNLSFEKRVAVLDRWWKETMEGKYKKHRLEGAIEKLKMRPNSNDEDIYEKLKEKLQEKWPVKVYTGPKIKVGVEKELCPNLVKLGDKVSFAKDFANWLTYRHRRNSIAGGDISELDLEEGDTPSSGFLSSYREVDGRIATPAIELSTSTSRYSHINVANIPRPSSIYGSEMRSLFGAGEGFVQLGYDFSSLENRIQGSYIYKYPGGPEMAEALVAEKPNDQHSLNAKKLGISRSDAKSFTYAVLYGSSANKIVKMLGVSKDKATELIESFWEGNPALNELKKNLTKHWESNNKKYIWGIDKRKVPTRSKHSIINALFQSGGVIVTKYTLVYAFQEFERLGYCIDPFKGKPDIGEMISYHDEAQLAVNPSLLKFKTFKSKEEAQSFVDNWEGEQLSDISNGKNDTFFVALPNDVSKTLTSSIKKAADKFNIPVELGIEWIVGRNWRDCH